MAHVPAPCTPPLDVMEKASEQAIVFSKAKDAARAKKQKQQQQQPKQQCKTEGGVGGTDSGGSHRIGGIGGSTASSSAASSSKREQQQQQQGNKHGRSGGKKVIKKPAAQKKPSGAKGATPPRPAPGTPRSAPWRPELWDGIRECQFCRNLVCACSAEFLQNVKRDEEQYGHYKGPLP